MTAARLATQVPLALTAAVALVPVIWTVLSSLKSNDTIFAVPMRWLPDSLHWNNYIDAFEVAPFARYFLNSAIVAASVTATTVFFGAMAGYGFSKFRFPGRDLVFGLILVTFMIPFPVIMIPCSFWSELWLGQHLLGSDHSRRSHRVRRLHDAPVHPGDPGRALRCGPDRWCRGDADLPHDGPAAGAAALATLGILTFLESWNNLLWPLIVIQSDEMETIPLGLTKFSTLYSSNYAQMLAMAVIASLPVPGRLHHRPSPDHQQPDAERDQGITRRPARS